MRMLAGAASALLLAAPPAIARAPVAVVQPPAVRPHLSLADLRQRYADRASRYAVVDGIELHYKDEGRGPALLLVHGSSSTMQTWDRVAPILARHYRVIRYDVPGQGLSGDVSDAAASLAPAAVAEHLLARLGVTRVTAIGVSSGGTLVEYLAARRPDLVGRLIVSNAPSDPVDTSHLAVTPAWARAQADAKASGVQGPAFWSEFLTFFAGDGRRIDAATRRRFADLNDRAPDRNMIALTAKVADHAAAVAAFAAVTAPTLLIWGGSDKLLPPASARVLAAYLTGTEPSIVYLPDVGHFPPIETPDRFARVVETWMEAATPR